MAGLAGFTISPTESPSPGPGSNNRVPGHRNGNKGGLVFDVVLNDRQAPASKSPAREAISVERAQTSDRHEHRDAHHSERSTASQNHAGASMRADDATGRPDGSKPAQPVENENGLIAETAGDAETAETTGDANEEVDTGEVGLTAAIALTDAMQFQPEPEPGETEDGVNGNFNPVQTTDQTQDQTEPGLAVSGPVPIDIDANPVSPEPKGTIEEEETADNPAKHPVLPQEQLESEEQLAATASLIKPAEPSEAGAQLAPKTTPTPNESAAVTGEKPVTSEVAALADHLKKASGRDAAQAIADAETVEDEPSGPQKINPDAKSAAEKLVEKTDLAAPKPQNSAIASEAAPASRTPLLPSEVPQGNALAPQAQPEIAVFRASTRSAAGAAPNLPVRAIALHIASRAAGGASTFQIRLDPPEMGRIDVKLEIAADGKVRALLTVDRPETLEALLRDQRGLERTLQNAGLDTRDDGLSFNLRQDAEARRDETNQSGDPNNTGTEVTPEQIDDPSPGGRAQLIGLSAIDIHV